MWSYVILITYLLSPMVISNTEVYTSGAQPGVLLATADSTAVQIVDVPKPTKVILGLTASLSCGVKAGSAAGNYTRQWLFNRQPIVKSSRIQVLPDGTLQIEQARNTDVGVYTCNVTAEWSSDTQSARLDLIEIPHPPRQVRATLFPNSALVNVSWTPPFDGNSAILKYIVQSRIIPNYHETGNDAVVDVVPFTDQPINVSASQTFALVSNLRPAMTYQFRVIAVNAVGKGQPSTPTTPPVTLPAQPPSAPPIGVVGAARSSTTIYIQWQPPALEGHNGQLYGYRVRYKLAGYHKIPWFHRNITNAGQLTYILDDLIVWKNYEIQVGAYNEVGVGEYSPSVYIRTKEGRPDSAPSSVSATPLNSTCVKVNWLPPDPQLINGINQGYKIRAFSLLDNSTREMLVEPHSLPDRNQTELLSGLEPFTEYMINVLCFTSAGDGPPNEPSISVKTLQGKPGKPSSLSFQHVLHSSLDLNWEPPKRINGELIAYSLRYAAINAASPDEWKVLNFSQHVLRAQIDRLLPETDYRFELNAWTQMGAGPACVASVRSGIPPVLPAAPTKLAISNIGAQSVVLQFTPGFNGNSTILRYLVEAQRTAHPRRGNTYVNTLPGHPVTEDWAQIFDSENVSQPDAITVHNLQPYTGYRLRLIPVNIVGRSPLPSEPSPPFQTFQAPPASPPPNVTTQSFNPTSILVMWNPLPLSEWNGEPRGYNISWRMLSDDPHSSADAHRPQWSTVPLGQRTHLITGLRNITDYAVQVQSINDVGASSSSRPLVQRTSDRVLPMPSNLQLRTRLPFYFERWFVAGVAALMLLCTIILIGALCMQGGKAHQYKQPVAQALMQVGGKMPISGHVGGMMNGGDAMSMGTLTFPGAPIQNQMGTLRPVQMMNVERDIDYGLDEMADTGYMGAPGYATTGRNQREYGYRAAASGSSGASSGGQLARAKCPPRPAPGSLSYSDDEDQDTKAQMYGGSSSGSCSEKPSESSSAADTDSDQDDDEMANRHFVNHYANVNDTLKKGHPSWKKQAHAYVVRSQRDLPSSVAYAAVPGPSGIGAMSVGALNQMSSGSMTPVAGPSGMRRSSQSSLQVPRGSNMMADSNCNVSNNGPLVNASSSMMINTSDMNNYRTGTLTRESPITQQLPPPPSPSQVSAPPSYNQLDASDLDSPANLNLNGGRIVVNNMAGSRAPLPGFSSFV